MNAVFQYGEKELNYLRKCDGRMAGLIERFGMIQREVVPDIFTALVGNIIGQQVSGKAAAYIISCAKCGQRDAATIGLGGWQWNVT